jgi:pilus assembly protein CpaB
MPKKNLMTLLGIALAVALVATGVFYGLFVTNLKSNNDSSQALVVAAKPLEAGKVLAVNDLKTVAWPGTQLPKGAFSDVNEVAGKTLFDAIDEAEPLFASRLLSKDGTGRSAGVPEGMRAVSVHVSDSSGVLEMLRPGHRVDVQVLVRRGKEANTIEVRTALEQLEVLSLNLKKDENSQGEELPVVTLLAKPAEADVLGLADSGARLRLTLRNSLDEGKRPGSAVSLPAIMQSALTQGR